MKTKTLAYVVIGLVAYRVLFGAWPAEDYYRQRTGRGYFD